jgi:hypothetical protein
MFKRFTYINIKFLPKMLKKWTCLLPIVCFKTQNRHDAFCMKIA